MKKIYLAVIVLLFCCEAANAYVDIYGRRHYRFAINVTNPISAFSKYGVGLEQRNGNFSYLFYYTKYISAYPGFQIGNEYQKYFRTKTKHQYYMYLRLFAGDVGFDSRKLAFYGEKTNILLGEYDKDLKYMSGNTYAGGALGFGRRYNYGVLFVRWNLGVKASVIVDEMPVEEKRMYRLMFATGPASILEFNVHVGLQL